MSKPLRVLIVEDSEDDALLCISELKHGGYKPSFKIVDSEQTMKSALDTQQWDVIISDYLLPEFDAIEALKVYKDSGIDIPFIVVSGSIGEDIAVHTMRCGAHDYLMKGNLTRLCAALEREMEEAGVRRNSVKQSERQLLRLKILEILNGKNESLREVCTEVLLLLKEYVGSDAIAFRLKDREDYPYYVSDGFDEKFIELEKSLLVRTKSGKISRDCDGCPLYACLCGIIVESQFSADEPFFTKDGSFWTNSTTDFLASNIHLDKKRKKSIRKTCNKFKYESVVLVPIKDSDIFNIGLIQINSFSRDFFDISDIKFIEEIGNLLGLGISRRRTEVKIRESEREMEIVLSASKTILNVIDSEYNLLYVDPATEKEQGDFRGRKCHDYFKNRKVSCHGCKVLEVLNTKKSTMNECYLEDKERDILITSAPFLDENGNVLIAQVRRDITEEKKMKAQLIQAEKLSGLGELTAGLTHELSSPLMGLLHLLKSYEKYVATESRESKELREMVKSVNFMQDIIENLNMFARKTKLKFIVLDLVDVIEDTLSFSAYHLEKNKIKLVKKYEDNLPKISGDMGQIQQVVINMITNARDAMPEGGRFTIAVRESCDKKKLIMKFTDTGKGIRKKDLPKIFDPFFTTKKVGKGTGLGLSVTHGIIENHKGVIEAESVFGQGTAFIVSLPVLKKGE